MLRIRGVNKPNRLAPPAVRMTKTEEKSPAHQRAGEEYLLPISTFAGRRCRLGRARRERDREVRLQLFCHDQAGECGEGRDGRKGWLGEVLYGAGAHAS